MEKSDLIFMVVVILAVLGISVYQLRISQMKTRDAQRKADVERVGKALTAYFDDHKILPMANTSGRIIACGRDGGETCEWGEGRIVDGDEVEYINRLPQDPNSNQGYRYFYSTDEKRINFKIMTMIEYFGDKDIDNNLAFDCGPNLKCKWQTGNN